MDLPNVRMDRVHLYLPAELDTTVIFIHTVLISHFLRQPDIEEKLALIGALG